MIVTLTDFGCSEYLGVMKGVINSINPDTKIIDLYNDVQPQNIKEAAWILLKNYKYFPKGTIFLCIVDPNVGGKRKSLAVKTKNYYFVGPDNGLMYPATRDDGIEFAIDLDISEASQTFHGRDVFAKMAAKIEKRMDIKKLGEKTGINNKLEFYLNGRIGEIVRVDRFGNIITNIKPLNKKMYVVKYKNLTKKLNCFKTYEAAPDNNLFLIVGSGNTLEISIKNKSAIQLFKVKVGDRIGIN